MNAQITTASVVAVMAGALAVVPAEALECPIAQLDGGTIVPAGKISEWGRRLASADNGNSIPEIEGELRRDNPDIKPGKIADILVEAYCKAIAAKGFDGSIATEKVRRFAEIAYQRAAR